ncbi:MAG: hypothetical protein R3C03_13430 [Pirellulaceae bacterium]
MVLQKILERLTELTWSSQRGLIGLAHAHLTHELSQTVASSCNLVGAMMILNRRNKPDARDQNHKLLKSIEFENERAKRSLEQLRRSSSSIELSISKIDLNRELQQFVVEMNNYLTLNKPMFSINGDDPERNGQSIIVNSCPHRVLVPLEFSLLFAMLGPLKKFHPDQMSVSIDVENKGDWGDVCWEIGFPNDKSQPSIAIVNNLGDTEIVSCQDHLACRICDQLLAGCGITVERKTSEKGFSGKFVVPLSYE